MGRRLLLITLVAAGWLGGVPAVRAQAEDDSPHSDVALLAERTSIQPGVPFTVALRMTMDAHWHSYWQNPGDAGMPTSIEWSLPVGFTAGPIQWPFPHRIVAGPLVSYGYSDEVVLPVTITPPATLAFGTEVTLNGRVDWLICADICLPAFSDVSLTSPVTEAPPAVDAAMQRVFGRARAALPVALEDWHLRGIRSNNSFALEITPPPGADLSLDDVYFYAAKKDVVESAAPQPLARDGRVYQLALQQSSYAATPPDRLTGTLVLPEGRTWDGTHRALEVGVALEEGANGTAGAATPEEGSMSLLLALAFALAGGIVLNLMPCVFPVLSIKILGFAGQSRDDAATMRRHGVAFAAGVVVSFLALAGLLLVLRAGGQALGWGFQLQSPLFVAFMAVLFTAIGLNLLGVFEVGASLMGVGGSVDQGASLRGAFFSGVLATVIASPCTAPLMGAALGFAVVQPAAVALAIFAALGLGMALPYVVLSFSPALLRRLPRPGAWMETLRQAMAFPILATVVWLVWVFGLQTGPGGMALLLGGLLLTALAAWIVGRWPAVRLSRRARAASRTVVTLALAGTAILAVLAASHRSSGADDTQGLDDVWQRYSADAVSATRAEGRPVFIDFTAAWCLTCQVNERTALAAEDVEHAFVRKNVARFRADWTSRDDRITDALQGLGRSGVPVYVLYAPGDDTPTLLPEILTPSIVLDALDDLPDTPVADAAARQ